MHPRQFMGLILLVGLALCAPTIALTGCATTNVHEGTNGEGEHVKLSLDRCERATVGKLVLLLVSRP